MLHRLYPGGGSGGAGAARQAESDVDSVVETARQLVAHGEMEGVVLCRVTATVPRCFPFRSSAL